MKCGLFAPVPTDGVQEEGGGVAMGQARVAVRDERVDLQSTDRGHGVM